MAPSLNLIKPEMGWHKGEKKRDANTQKIGEKWGRAGRGPSGMKSEVDEEREERRIKHRSTGGKERSKLGELG